MDVECDGDEMRYIKKPGSQHWGLFIPRESENQINVGLVSIWNVKEPCTDDDKCLSSGHPQYQHRKIGMAKMF